MHGIQYNYGSNKHSTNEKLKKKKEKVKLKFSQNLV